jgi:hypothetical protein
VVAPLVAIAGADMHVLTLPVVVRRRITAVPLVWLIVGAMWTQQSVVYDLLHGGLGDRTWLQIARGDMISAALWAILTVPILYLARRFPLERNRPARLGAYASAALLTPILHVALQQRFAYPEIPLSSRVWEMPLMVDIAIFCIVVVVAHHSLFAAWLRAHEAATVVLSSEVATARADVGRLQQIPRVILDSIHAVAETVHVDPSLAERQLSCLARYLRLALDSAAGPHVVQEREVALEAAVAALRTNGVYITALSG